jgi:hypothetical protein
MIAVVMTETSSAPQCQQQRLHRAAPRSLFAGDLGIHSDSSAGVLDGQ